MPPMQNFSNAFGDPAELQAYLAQKAAGGGPPGPLSLGGAWGGSPLMRPFQGGGLPFGGGETPPWAPPGGGMASYLNSGYKPPWMSDEMQGKPEVATFEPPAPGPDITAVPKPNPGMVSKPGPGLVVKPGLPPAGGVMRQPGKPGAAMGARPPMRPMPGKPAAAVNSNPFADARPPAPTSPPQPALSNPMGGQAGRIQALLARIRSSGQGGAGMAA